MAYVGGVGGKNAYADWTDITVDVDDTSYVKAVSTEGEAAYRTYVGGVIGFMGEGGHTVKNVTSNIDVIGDVCDVGGIVGIAHYGNNFENITCTGDVRNDSQVADEAVETGGIAGVWHNELGQQVTFTDCEFTGTVKANGEDVTATAGIVGAPYNAGNVTEETSGKLIVDGEQVYPALAAQVGDIKYASLKKAINAAQAGNTVTLLRNIEEDVTIDKNITIDGADKNYTGTMTVANGKTVTVQNVNFVKGCIDKAKGTSGTLTVKNCDFDGVDGSINYAITMRGGNAVTVEGGTVKNYGYGFIYVPSATSNVTVKETTVEEVNYGVHVAYGSKINLEEVTMTDVAYGIMTQNYGAKAITIKNCEINGTNPISVWERNTTVVDTFNFEGENTVSALPTSAQAKLQLAEDAALTAPEGANVTTTVENSEVEYVSGTYYVVPKVRVAQIGDVQYKTLAAAIAAAEVGAEIELIADVTEDVTISKNITIDGADFDYTGTMSVSNGKTVTVENVNFVKGCIDKAKGTSGTLTVKNCNFDGVDESINYAITMRGGSTVTVEGGTVKNYGYGFIYVPSAVSNVNVTDVKVTGVNYGVHVAYGSKINLEEVTMTDVAYGIMTQNYGAKAITIKNCEINGTNPISVWERNTTVVDTFNFEGENTVSALPTSAQAKLQLVAADATLTAPAGSNVTTTIDKSEVVYEDGAYKVKAIEAVAKIGDVDYYSLQEAINVAQDGDVVTLAKDIDVTTLEIEKLDGSYDTYFKVEGKTITVDLAGYEITGEYAGTGMLVGVFSTENNGNLTLTGNGTVDITATGKVYSLIANYEAGCTITIENGTYNLDKASDSLVYTGGTSGITVNGGDFTLGNVGTGENDSPWIFNAYKSNQYHVTVNGGTFNADVNHQYWAHEVNVPKEKALDNNGDGTWTVVDAVAYAVEEASGYNRSVGYATLAEALAAPTASKVVVLADTEETNIMVPDEVMLDLNGFTLTAKYFSCFGNIVDNSEANTGVLVSSNIMLQQDNEQLPIKNGEGYQFFEVRYIVSAFDSAGKYVFATDVEPAAHSLLTAGSAVSGVDTVVRVSWTDGEQNIAKSQDFIYTNELVKGFFESYSASTDWYSSMYTLKIANADSYDNLTYNAGFKSDLGVEIFQH